ncbi:MAG TPA: NYN domain-containing protein [Candidatus Udaeobacter sp.]|nr:NYN domain-containing protein [Candidatus Udaeobacter sp.]
MQKKDSIPTPRSKVLVLVDESNVSSSVRTVGRGLDWLKLRDFLAGQNTGRDLIEMVIYAGLPPAISTWQEERDKKNKFVHWLRSNGFMVVTKDGAPAEEGHYKANVDVMMAIDALELSIEMRPDSVILVTGDADFAYLATKLRRHGIRVEVASVAANLGHILRSAANHVIDLTDLFRTFEVININTREAGCAPTGSQPVKSPARSEDARVTNVQDASAKISHHRTQQERRRRPRFRPKQNAGGT